MNSDRRTVLPEGKILRERYVLDRVVGIGGFGTAYRAWDPVLDCYVAIKEYRLEPERFLEEARVMAQFRSCENIVYVYDFFLEGKAAFIVMEFLIGETLAQRLSETGTLELCEALHISVEILKGLEMIHAGGIVHRDIAPDNVFLLEDGRVKLFDLGCARKTGTTGSGVEVKNGYSSPEQYIPGQKAEAASDIYSVSAVLYRMLSGTVPPAALNRLRKDELPALLKNSGRIPKPLKGILAAGLALQPPQRPESAKKLRIRINGCFEKTQKKEAVGANRSGRWKRLYPAAGVFLIIIGILTVPGGRNTVSAQMNRDGKQLTAQETAENPEKKTADDLLRKEAAVTEKGSVPESAPVPESASMPESVPMQEPELPTDFAGLQEPELLTDSAGQQEPELLTDSAVMPETELHTEPEVSAESESLTESKQPPEPETAPCTELLPKQETVPEPESRNAPETVSEAVASGPVLMADGWHCLDASGVSLKNQMVEMDGEFYYFGQEGVLLTERLLLLEGELYYLDENGCCIRNQWKELQLAGDGSKYRYYFTSSGKAFREGCLEIDGMECYFVDFRLQ